MRLHRRPSVHRLLPPQAGHELLHARADPLNGMHKMVVTPFYLGCFLGPRGSEKRTESAGEIASERSIPTALERTLRIG
jgi:hypothetical protein